MSTSVGAYLFQTKIATFQVVNDFSGVILLISQLKSKMIVAAVTSQSRKITSRAVINQWTAVCDLIRFTLMDVLFKVNFPDHILSSLPVSAATRPHRRSPFKYSTSLLRLQLAEAIYTP